jgi:hypothetical protein
MEFEQCPERQGTNVKCEPVKKRFGKDSLNYCSKHLVESTDLVECSDADGNAA